MRASSTSSKAHCRLRETFEARGDGRAERLGGRLGGSTFAQPAQPSAAAPLTWGALTGAPPRSWLLGGLEKELRESQRLEQGTTAPTRAAASTGDQGGVPSFGSMLRSDGDAACPSATAATSASWASHCSWHRRASRSGSSAAHTH